MKNMFKKQSKKVEFSLSTIQNNPATRTQLEGFIEELASAKGLIKTHQGTISDIRKEANDNLGIPGKILMKLLREHMSVGTIESEINDLETVQALSDVIEGKNPVATPAP